MESLPIELIVCIVPDPDALSSMLRASKWVSAALTAAGKFVLKNDRNGIIELHNNAVTFTVESVDLRVVVSKTAACGSYSFSYTFTDMYSDSLPARVHAMGLGGGMCLESIGWDTVKYKNKYTMIKYVSKLEASIISRTSRSTYNWCTGVSDMFVLCRCGDSFTMKYLSDERQDDSVWKYPFNEPAEHGIYQLVTAW